MSTISMQGMTYVGVSGNYVYAGDMTAGKLRVIDISNPLFPNQIDSVLVIVTGLLVKDNLLFIATDTGLTIYSITSPASPQLISAIATSGSRTGVKIAEDRGFVYMAYDQLHAIDISDLAQPREVATALENSAPFGVAAKGESVYVISPEYGVWILKNKIVTSDQDEFSVPEAYGLRQNYPNPFNPRTQIEYEVPHAGNISLRIYNIFGQEVATLTEGIHSAGNYHVSWNAEGIASGVYFCGMNSEGKTITRKMLLLR